MCVKSHRHLCLQIFLIILLLLCFAVFATIIITDISLFLLTSSASTVQDDSSNSAAITSSVAPALTNDQMILLDPSTNATVSSPLAQVASDPAKTDDLYFDDDDPNAEVDLPLADWLVDKIVNSNCSWVNSTVQTGQLLDLCDATVDPFSTDRALVQCFRK